VQDSVQQSPKAESGPYYRVDGGAIAGPLEFPISGGEHAKIGKVRWKRASRRRWRRSCFPTWQRDRAHGAPRDAERWCIAEAEPAKFFCPMLKEAAMRRLVRGIGTRIQRRSAGNEMRVNPHYDSQASPLTSVLIE